MPPRLSTFSSSGVNWKRKKSFNNTHLTQYVDINRLFEVLEYLIDHNPLYQTSTIDHDFLERVRSQDPSGNEFFIDQNTPEDNLDSEDDDMFLQISENIEDMRIDEVDDKSQTDDELEQEAKEYDEYAETDPIRRHQFDYDELVA